MGNDDKVYLMKIPSKETEMLTTNEQFTLYFNGRTFSLTPPKG